MVDSKGKPVILTHEAGMIDSDNVQQEQIGTILSEGMQDGDNVRAQIIIHDAHKLDYGLRELSLGYSLDLEELPGEWQGQPYDAIQRNITSTVSRLFPARSSTPPRPTPIPTQPKPTAKAWLCCTPKIRTSFPSRSRCRFISIRPRIVTWKSLSHANPAWLAP